MYRPTTNRLICPFLDPQGFGDGTTGQVALASATTPGTWVVDDTVAPVPWHVFDAQETADGIFLCGAADNAGQVWRSTDGGATWTQSLTVPGDASSRIVTLLSLGGELATVSTVGSERLYTWNGSSWTAGDTLPLPISDSVPFTHNATPFLLCFTAGKINGQAQNARRTVMLLPRVPTDAIAIEATIPLGNDGTFRGWCTDGTYLYLLDSGGSVWRGDDAGTWARLFTLDLIPTCMTVVGAAAYFGTSDSKVYSTPIA